MNYIDIYEEELLYKSPKEMQKHYEKKHKLIVLDLLNNNL